MSWSACLMRRDPNWMWASSVIMAFWLTCIEVILTECSLCRSCHYLSKQDFPCQMHWNKTMRFLATWIFNCSAMCSRNADPPWKQHSPKINQWYHVCPTVNFLVTRIQWFVNFHSRLDKNLVCYNEQCLSAISSNLTGVLDSIWDALFIVNVQVNLMCQLLTKVVLQVDQRSHEVNQHKD